MEKLPAVGPTNGIVNRLQKLTRYCVNRLPYWTRYCARVAALALKHTIHMWCEKVFLYIWQTRHIGHAIVVTQVST